MYFILNTACQINQSLNSYPTVSGECAEATEAVIQGGWMGMYFDGTVSYSHFLFYSFMNLVVR